MLTKQLQALVEMQEDPVNFSKIAQVQQRDRVLGLQVQTGQARFSQTLPCRVHIIEIYVTFTSAFVGVTSTYLKYIVRTLGSSVR